MYMPKNSSAWKNIREFQGPKCYNTEYLFNGRSGRLPFIIIESCAIFYKYAGNYQYTARQERPYILQGSGRFNMSLWLRFKLPLVGGWMSCYITSTWQTCFCSYCRLWNESQYMEKQFFFGLVWSDEEIG